MIFVDSSFWIALENTRDAHHADAIALLTDVTDVAGSQLVTTNHVRGETWTWIRRLAGHRDAVRFLDRVDDSERVQVIHVSEELEERATSWLRKRHEREYSFFDATSFALMRSMKIKDSLAFDGELLADSAPLRCRPSTFPAIAPDGI